MALAYHGAGFVVVIDDFLDPDHRSDYEALLAHPDLHKIVLFPDQEAAHRRNLQRSGETPARAYIDEGVRTVYRHFSASVPQIAQEWWLVVDTTTLSVEDTVAEILQRTAAGG